MVNLLLYRYVVFVGKICESSVNGVDGMVLFFVEFDDIENVVEMDVVLVEGS